MTIVSEMLCNEKNIDFSPTSLNPTSASGDQFPLIGEFSCDVTFGDESHFSTIYVSRNNSLNVLGNDLLTVSIYGTNRSINSVPNSVYNSTYRLHWTTSTH